MSVSKLQTKNIKPRKAMSKCQTVSAPSTVRWQSQSKIKEHINHICLRLQKKLLQAKLRRPCKQHKKKSSRLCPSISQASVLSVCELQNASLSPPFLSGIMTHHRYDSCFGWGRKREENSDGKSKIKVLFLMRAEVWLYTMCICIVIMPNSDKQLAGCLRLSHRCKSHTQQLCQQSVWILTLLLLHTKWYRQTYPGPKLIMKHAIWEKCKDCKMCKSNMYLSLYWMMQRLRSAFEPLQFTTKYLNANFKFKLFGSSSKYFIS